MHRDELRARVQPSLLQDFDAVYDEYVLDEGHGRLRPFVEHLASFSLLPSDIVLELLADVPDAEPTEAAASQEPAESPGPPEVEAEVEEEAEEAEEAGAASGNEDEEEDEDEDEDEVETSTLDDDEPTEPVADELPAEVREAMEEAEARTALSRAETVPPSDHPDHRDAPHEPVEPFAPVVPKVDSSAETVQLPTREALLAAEEAAARATGEAPDDTVDRPAQPAGTDSVHSKTTVNLERPDLSTLLDNADSDSDEWEDVPDDDGHKRTMFRRMTGGALRETGRFGDGAEPPRRRRRRRRLPKGDAHYQFEGTVGEGAMGRVLLARDQKLHRPVAYKAMSEDLLKQPTLASKFSAEARITAQLDHPAIVPVYTLESDTAYTMKLIEGETLEQVFDGLRDEIKARRKVPEHLGLERRLEMFLRVCEAVSYAHSRGVIHRDLKPENIMVGQWGEVFVMDWGIAKVFDSSVEHPVDTGSVEEDEGDLIIGTAGYMSPEQAEGLNHELVGASDQYALGLILFELVCLKPAVTGKVPLKMVMRHQDGEKDPLVHLGGDRLPRELVAIIHKATAKPIQRRYPDVSALAEDLRRYLRGEPVLARPDGPLQALSRWIGRHREITLFAVVASFISLFLLIGVVGAYGQIQLARAQAREQRVSNLLTTAARQASQLDGQFLKMEGLLSVVGTAASEALQRPASANARVFLERDFGAPGTAPPDAARPRDADKYGDRLVSTTHPVFVSEEISPNALRLGNMGRHFQRVLLRSHSEKRAVINPAMARRTIVDVDIPVSWAFVTLADGLLVTFPGHDGWGAVDDARELDWYVAAAEKQTPVWTGVRAHPVQGDRQVLTVSQGLFDNADETMGVAGLHLSLPRLLDTMMPEELRDSDVQTFLLDEEGRVVVHSALATDPGAGVGNTFDVAEVVDAVREHKSGLHWASGTEIVAYNRLTSNGWTFVMRGSAEDLLQ